MWLAPEETARTCRESPILLDMSLYRALIWLKAAENRLWVKPAMGSVVAVLIAMAAALANRLIPAGLLPDIERSTLDSLLGVIASSMLGVATFSLSIMVAAFSSAAAGASPRAIQLVAGDADTQNAITTFISAFIYAIIANTALGLGLYGDTGRFILFVCTMGVLLYLIVTLIQWVKTLSVLGRMENTLAKLETAAVEAMASYRQSPGMGARVAPAATPSGQPVRAKRVGYLRHITWARCKTWQPRHRPSCTCECDRANWSIPAPCWSSSRLARTSTTHPTQTLCARLSCWVMDAALTRIRALV